MSQYRQHRHIGVYGVCIVDGHVLLVHKARGPYTGLLDLPGGGIEFGEAPEAALRREFIEETGIIIDTPLLLCVSSNQVHYVASDGVPEELHHFGLIYSVSVAPHEQIGHDSGMILPAIKSLPDGQDSGGAIWIPLNSLDTDTLTPFAQSNI